MARKPRGGDSSRPPKASQAEEAVRAVDCPPEQDLGQEEPCVTVELREECVAPIPADDPQEPEGKGHFLTTEELHTLSEVLGHFPDFSEHHDDDPADLGVPSTDWNSVYNELRGMRSSIEGLQAAAAEIGTLKPLLAEIRAEVDVGKHRRDILTSSLSTLSEDMHEVRLQISATSKSAVDSAASVRGMHNQMKQEPGTVAISTDRCPEWPILLVGFGVLPLSWAAAFYLKTGDLRTALGGLIIANLATCATMMFARSRNRL